MNSLNLTQLGGLPLTQQDIKWLQDSYSSAFSALANFIGDKVIISGMVEGGGSVTSGWISWNGELIPFLGGSIGTGLFAIDEVATTRIFHDGSTNPVRIDRVAKFSAGGSFNYSQLIRREMVKDIWQAGDIKQINCDATYLAANFDGTGKGVNLRTGWAICNGNNGTINLKGRFLVGYDPADSDYNTVGDTGGEKRHTLTALEIPAHDHSNGSYNRLLKQDSNGTISGGVDTTPTEPNLQSSAAIQSVGGGQPHENRPPFYTILFIQKL